MKKRISLFGLLIAFVLAGLFPANAFAAQHTLEEVADAFNSCKSVSEYKEVGYTVKAEIPEDNLLRASMTDGGETSVTVDFALDGSILTNDQVTADQLILMLILADSIGQVNGYEDGELFDTFNSKEASDYTVENEGFELKENGDYYAVKMDIDKKVPLVDLTDYYLTPDDFDFVQGKGVAGEYANMNGRSLKMAYDVTVSEQDITILIGEKDANTQSTYNSILSAIEAVYNKEVAEYFQSEYASLDDGNVMYDGFSVEQDVEKEDNAVFDDTIIVKVVFDNEYIKDKFFRTEYIGETVERGEKTLTIDFSNNNSYKMGFFDSISESGDVGFLYRYILEPLFVESGAEMVDNTVYYNIVDGKLVVGDKDNSVFKLVILEDALELSLSDASAAKTTVNVTCANVKATEYKEGKSGVHERYGNYQVTLNLTYGKEQMITTDIPEKNESMVNNDQAGKDTAKTNEQAKNAANSSPKTGDMANAYRVLLYAGLITASFVVLAFSKKERENKTLEN